MVPLGDEKRLRCLQLLPMPKPYFHPAHPCFLILIRQCFCGILLDLRGDNLGNHGDIPFE